MQSGEAMSLYPDFAGFKEQGATSEQAAHDIEATGKAQILRDRIKALFRIGENKPGVTATADEVAEFIGESVLSVRPRISELRTNGLITPTGERRRSHGGRMSHVWMRK